MVRDHASGVLKPDLFYDTLIQVIPELSSLAEIQVEIPFVLDSADINVGHWQQLAALIRGYVDRVQGVVITHGTDTLAYTASALSFMLMNTPVPVILTGAQRPLAELRSDARANLINAVELATMPISEVGLLFDHKLMRGNRASKCHINHFDAFFSPNYPLLANVGINIDIYTPNLLAPAGMFHVFDHFDTNVAVLKLFPGCSGQGFEPGPEIRAVVVIAFGAGTMPLQAGALHARIEGWIKSGKLVVLMSEARGGRLSPGLYESGKRLLDLGVLSGGDMTFEAVVTKLMFLLGQYQDAAIIRRNFATPLAGELTLTA
jgi:L-asparaginase